MGFAGRMCCVLIAIEDSQSRGCQCQGKQRGVIEIVETLLIRYGHVYGLLRSLLWVALMIHISSNSLGTLGLPLWAGQS